MYNINFSFILKLLFVMVMSPQIAFSAKDKHLYCGACKAIMSEVDYSVKKVDPNKKIDVGGYRLDSNGKSRVVKKSYARSESHLTDVLENICKDISDNYIESKHPETGKKMLRRMVTHDGEMSSDVDFRQLLEDSQKQDASTPPSAKSNTVKFACESIVEDFEDDIVQHFMNAEDNVTLKVCSQIAKYCEEVDVKDEL